LSTRGGHRDGEPVLGQFTDQPGDHFGRTFSRAKNAEARFEDLDLHRLDPGISPESDHLRSLVPGQPLDPAGVDIVGLHPAAQTRLRDPQITGDLRDRVLPGPGQLHSTTTELRRLRSRHHRLLSKAIITSDQVSGKPGQASSLAQRHQQLTEEITDLDGHLTRLVTHVAPDLIAVKGLGPLTSAALLVAVGDNPDRLRTESAFAHLCGVAPVPASSGKTTRYRLNRGGDRQANYAL